VILADTLAQACGDDPGVACRNVYDWTGNAALAEVANWLVDVPLRIALILLVAWVATRVARRVIRRSARRLATSADEGALGRVGQTSVVGAAAPDPVRVYARMGALENVLGSVVSTIIWVIAGLVALGELNINLGPLIAGAGIAGVALGFGAQQVVRDYLSGVFIVSEDQFGPGDTIDLQDVSGTVESVSLRSTKVRDVDGVLWTVANGEILKVGNATKGWSRSKLDVSVAYGTDLRRAMDVVREVGEGLRADPEWEMDVLEPPDMWGIQHLAADGVTIRLVLKVRPGRQYAVTRELQLRIAERLEAEGIEIPFPQRTLWLRNREDEDTLTGEPGAADGEAPS
jgi:small conductance mechanosensitive channel